MKPCTRAEIMTQITGKQIQYYAEFVSLDKVPKPFRELVAQLKYSKIKYRRDHKVVEKRLNLHDHIQRIIPVLLDIFPEEDDVYITGSWILGTYSYKDNTLEDKKILRRYLNKPDISDVDLWTKKTPLKEAKMILYEEQEKRKVLKGYKFDVLQWWGPGLSLDGKDTIGLCNNKSGNCEDCLVSALIRYGFLKI